MIRWKYRTLFTPNMLITTFYLFQNLCYLQHALVYQSGYVRPSQVKANPVGMVAMSDNGHCSV
jgi:hypothetical protein